MISIAHVAKTSSWVDSRIRRPAAQLRLFCFSYAGGNGSAYRSWQDILPSYLDVCPIVLPGRGARYSEPPFDRMESLVKEAAVQLLHLCDRPFAVFGHSLGALVGFEFTRLLQFTHKLSPVQLFVAGRSAPHINCDRSPIHNLPETDFISELRRLQGTPEELLANSEAMQTLIPSLRADFAVAETYEHKQKLALECPLMAIGGIQDSDTPVSGLEEWRRHTHGEFAMAMVPGKHFFLRESSDQVINLVSKTLGLRSTQYPGTLKFERRP